MEVHRSFLAFSCLYLITLACAYDITILHTNDVHARFEQFNRYASACSQDDITSGTCFGGVARRHTKIQEIRRSHGNVMLMDAGDQFVGTTWFNVHKGNATSYFMNKLGYDIMCLGNHEFDLGVAGLAPFLDNVTFPVVSSNIDVSQEPRLIDKFSKSWVANVGGEQIGVVGYITPETKEISNAGPTVRFTDVLSSVREEVRRLESLGINKIIALGHAGFSMDKQVASIAGVDLAVGGHTNTFLYNGIEPSGEVIIGKYPEVVEQDGGGQGLVVQAYTMGKYLGYLNLTFDASGVVTQYSGNPILLDTSIEEDPDMLQYIAEWRKPVDALAQQVIGFSKVLLDGERESCRLKECNLGNMITDAIIDHHQNFTHPEDQWAPSAIALWNGGGIRSSINKGVVDRGEAMTVMPFGNEIDLVTVSGSNLRAQLEISVQDYDPVEQHGRFLQMSGLRVVYNLQMPPGQRVVSAEVRCLKCDIPSYSPLSDREDYVIFVSTFLLGGGDGYRFQPKEHLRFNTPDIDTLVDYITKHSPVAPQVEGRIRFQKDIASAAPALSRFSVVIFVMQILYFLLCW